MVTNMRKHIDRVFDRRSCGPLAWLLLVCIVMVPAHTGAEQKAVTGKQGDGSYTWYDGKHKRTIWLNPSLVAEFEPKSLDHAQSKTLAASATPLPLRPGSVRLWRIDSTVTGKSSAQLASQLAAGKLSPVMQDGGADTGRKRALPGNIIVHLQPAWTQQQVDNWLANHSLQVIKRLEIGPNIYLIKTAAGLAALELANALYLSGEVVAAYPDWWVEVHKK